MADPINAPAAEAAVAARIQSNGFTPIVDQCVGCAHVRLLGEVGYCHAYASPAGKWAAGMCNFATHAKIEKAKSSKMLNPLKASKRGGN
jgi:hypothetical protein